MWRAARAVQQRPGGVRAGGGGAQKLLLQPGVEAAVIAVKAQHELHVAALTRLVLSGGRFLGRRPLAAVQRQPHLLDGVTVRVLEVHT